MGVLTSMVEADNAAREREKNAEQLKREMEAIAARKLAVPAFIERVKNMLGVTITAKQTSMDVVPRDVSYSTYITTEIDNLLVGMTVYGSPKEMQACADYVWLYLFARCPQGHVYQEHAPMLRADEPKEYPHVIARAYSEQERMATSCSMCKAEDLAKTTRQEFDAMLAQASVQEIRAMLGMFTDGYVTEATLRLAMEVAAKVRQVCPRCGGPHRQQDCGSL